MPFMIEKLTFLGLAEKVLRNVNKPLSPYEMWKYAQSKGWDSLLTSQGKTPAHTLYSSVFVNARDSANPIFYRVGVSPARYFLKELQQDFKVEKLEKVAQETDVSDESLFEYDEADLHPFLTFYARNGFQAYTKTIHHTKSTKKEFGEWVHPDQIGVYFPVKDWKTEVLDLSAAIGNNALRFYSFELKKTLSFGNLREAFFQAVSNSSWANEGYLVAAEISQDEDFLTELRRLSTSFGIGVIELSLDDPNSSKTLYPSRERDSIDWETLNKLSTMNKDVLELVTRIKKDLQTKEFIEERYDEILDAKTLMQSVKKKC